MPVKNKGGRPSGEKTRCSGKWTEAKFNSFIKGNLRRCTMKWGPIGECLKNATTRRGFKLCAGCGEEVPVTIKKEGARGRTKNVHVDHITPIISVEEGFTTWDDVVDRMFCELDNLQVLCSKCHDEKTDKEKEGRKVVKKYATQYKGTYNSWKSMLARCREGHHQEDTYFQRGIDVCDRWKESFFYFLEDMGERPEGMTLDREDNDVGYSPDNCRWANPQQQARNRTNSHWLVYGGVSKTVSEWSEVQGIPASTILNRLGRGDSVEEALNPNRVKRVRKSKMPIKDIYKDSQEGLTYVELGLKYKYHPDTIRKAIYKEREKNGQ